LETKLLYIFFPHSGHGEEMKIKPALVLDSNETLSKALEDLMENGTAVIITKNGLYHGLVDDRNLREGITDPSKLKCEGICVKAPSLTAASSLEERLNAFLTGHFKALPVIDSKGKPSGLYTRADLLAEMLAMKLLPKDYVRTLMNSPVYTVNESDTVAAAKKKMKELSINRIVVTRNGRPAGIVSTHDFTSYLITPQSRRGKQPLSDLTNPNNMPVSSFMRDEVPMIDHTALLEDAMRKMADGNFSSVVVVSDHTALGVLSATDVFKHVLKLASSEPDVLVSGLGEDDAKHLEYVKKTVLGSVAKFSKSFEISGMSLHMKKGKSVYEAKLHLSIDGSPLVIAAEGYDLKEAVDALAKEVHNLLSKRKGKSMDKKVRRE
jgi:CBS domain-containing protein